VQNRRLLTPMKAERNIMFYRVASVACLGLAVVACSTAPVSNNDTSPPSTTGSKDAAAPAPETSPDVAQPPVEDATPPTTDTVAPPLDAQVDLPVTAGPDGPVLTSKDFTCSWVIGITTTGEWYSAGFENVVDNARWQNTHVEMGHLEKWADPQNGIWQSGIYSACAMNSKTPDRIVYCAVKYEWTTLEQFLPAYVAVINNIKTKYPSVKRVDLMTYARGPGNLECKGANRSNDSYIKDVQDQAAAMVADMFPGFVFIAPKWEVKSCGDFGLCPHISGAANALEAKTIGEYFLTH
jgi:hypothetical protein